MIKVLDKGYVKYVAHMGDDSTVIEAARMSTGKGFLGWEPGICCVKCAHPASALKWNGDEDGPCPAGGTHRIADHKGDAHLLEFLYRNEHMTPFEMCELHIEIQAPIFVFRELMRHRTFSWNEFSARYAQMPNEHYVPDSKRFLPVYSGSKQQTSEATARIEANLDIDAARYTVSAEQEAVYESYEKMLRFGVPKEVARLNTPVSRYSKARMKANLRNWLQMLALRLPENVQWETRMFAQAAAGIVKGLWPRTYALFEEHTLNAVTVSKSELAELAEALDSQQTISEALQKKLSGK